MSVKRTNETTFKDNKNAKENLLKFSTAAMAIAAKFPQGFYGADERARLATHVSDFETEMDMEKETEILNTKRKEMAGIFALNRETVAAAAGETNHQHLQEQFNKSNYSTSSLSAAAAVASRAQNKAQKSIEMLEIKQQQQQQQQYEHQQQTANDLNSMKTQSPAKQAEDLKALPQHNVIDTAPPSPICLHIHICDSPPASLFQRSPLFWRCCCLCPNTMKLCSPILRDLIFLLCFIIILLFLILSATFSESYLRHYNATLCNDCTL
ncbi:hypothetical protein DOY81_000526 [Sarcophaga bullata]|nr:hypothetical protein DOY81_000526 [Sarcophaga bullata]